MPPRRSTCSYYVLACPLLPPRCPRWSSALCQLRLAFFPADKRIGGTWVWAEGVVGILRAVLLVAKVGVQVQRQRTGSLSHLRYCSGTLHRRCVPVEL